MGKTFRHYPERIRAMRRQTATLQYPGCEPETLNKNRNWELLDDLQHVANTTGHQVELKSDTFVHFDRVRGYTDKGHAGSFGSVVHHSYHIGRKKENLGALMVQPDVLPAQETIKIQVPLDATDFRAYNQMRVSPPDPCKGCFWREGRMWMLRGTGHKSKQKAKGMKRWTQKNEIQP